MRETLSDIALYHEYKSKTDTDCLLSQRTWDDLNLDDLSFDYKLKSGPVTERNAIRILEICGYPQEVVQEAYNAVAYNSV